MSRHKSQASEHVLHVRCATLFPQTGLEIVASVPAASGGVDPNPAMSNAMT
jgi:hypothetical protein